MPKTASVYARIEPEVKAAADMVFAQLGVPASVAIAMFYKQVAMRKALPFEVKVAHKLPDFSALSEQQQNEILEEGWRSASAESGIPAQEVFARLDQEFGF